MMGENKKSFSVTGMSCITCANAVEKSLKKIEGIKFASVNLATETAQAIARRVGIEKV